MGTWLNLAYIFIWIPIDVNLSRFKVYSTFKTLKNCQIMAFYCLWQFWAFLQMFLKIKVINDSLFLQQRGHFSSAQLEIHGVAKWHLFGLILVQMVCYIWYVTYYIWYVTYARLEKRSKISMWKFDMKLMTFPEPLTSSKNQSWNDKVHYCQQWKYLFQNYNYFRFYRPLCRKTLSHKSGELFLDMLHAGFYTLILDIAKKVKRP